MAENENVADADAAASVVRVRLGIAYDGTDFNGWSRQPGLRTVQGVLEEALATGIDARGRKQYRYHPDFRRRRECVKYDTLARFGEALASIRRRVAKDLARHKLSRERAVASVVRLLDTGAIRIGNEAYARDNKSFGATTLPV